MSNNSNRESSSGLQAEDEDLTMPEALVLLEFCFWVAILLLPILLYVNGPPVSRDQAILRKVLGIVVGSGAITLRIYHAYFTKRIRKNYETVTFAEKPKKPMT